MQGTFGPVCGVAAETSVSPSAWKSDGHCSERKHGLGRPEEGGEEEEREEKARQKAE